MELLRYHQTDSIRCNQWQPVEQPETPSTDEWEEVWIVVRYVHLQLGVRPCAHAVDAREAPAVSARAPSLGR